MTSVRTWTRWSAALLMSGFVGNLALADTLPAPPHADPRALAWEQLEVLPDVAPDLQSRVADSAETEIILERYSNRATKIERHVALDDQRNYVNHGPWKMWDARGQLVAQGQFLHGRMQGKWTRILPQLDLGDDTFAAPLTSQAQFAQGELHGVWSITDTHGRPVVSWEFRDGKLHGAMTAWYSQGQKRFDATFADGRPHGDATYWALDGRERKKEHYQHGDQRLQSVSWYDTQQKEAEGWIVRSNLKFDIHVQWWQGTLTIARDDSKAEDQKTGTWKEWYANGTPRFSGSFREGQPAGPHAWWHANGQKMMAGDFRTGAPEGRWTRWYPNGRKQEEGSYLAGTKRGTWTVWDETGSVADVQDFSGDGQVDSLPTVESHNVTFPSH